MLSGEGNLKINDFQMQVLYFADNVRNFASQNHTKHRITMVTYSELFEFMTVIISVITLLLLIHKKK